MLYIGFVTGEVLCFLDSMWWNLVIPCGVSGEISFFSNNLIFQVSVFRARISCKLSVYSCVREQGHHYGKALEGI